MKMKYLLMGLLLIGLISSANAAVIGVDSFDYPDGSNIDDQSGGTGWDAGGVKDWDIFWGNPAISNGAVTTNNAGIVRAFGADEHAGAIQATGQVYFGVTMTVTADAYDWAGLSTYDFGSERIFFGCPGAQPNSGPTGLGYYGIDIPGNPANALTTIPVVRDKPARIVGCIDFDGDQLLLWVNPDANDYDNGGGDNSADAVLAWETTNWCSAVRLASAKAVEWDDLMVAETWEEILYSMPYDPLPAFGQEGVAVSGLQLSWEVPLVKVQPDPNLPSELIVDPNLASFNLYYTDTDPNLSFVTPISITSWDAVTMRASHIPSPAFNKNSLVIWRVDSVMDDATIIQGFEWVFYTELTRPVIVTQPAHQIVDAGDTAVFSFEIATESPATYQWYQYVDGISDVLLTDGGDISGATTNTLSIANAELADEGMYYCITNNEANIEVPTDTVPLIVKRKIAYWPFDGGVLNSTIDGSPATVVVGDPNIAAESILGDAIEFDDGVDMLYTDPAQASYFDTCDYAMTVACWVKTTDNQDWCPLIARNGEGQGWQLRQSGFTDDRPCFTTRGTGNDDGTPANRAIYDGQWHYVVATMDGDVKKVYIDGIVSKSYSTDDGSFLSDGDAVEVPVNPSLSPVAIAGRVTGDATEGVTVETWNIVAGIYDEVEIYNYALDAATIAQIYADLSGSSVCLSQVYDLDGNCVVDLNDLGMLASEWLNSQLVVPTP